IRDNLALNQVGDIPSHQELISPNYQEALFADKFPQAIDNLEKLVSDIHYDLDRELKLPRFNRERVACEELRERAQEG
ncbi:hypothetical protein ACXWO5_11035, partial [Streptococcus pyogenes]